MSKTGQQPRGIFEIYQENAQKTAEHIARTRAKHRPVCAICLQEIGKSDFENGRFLFTDSKASGKVYICRKCTDCAPARQEGKGA